MKIFNLLLFVIFSQISYSQDCIDCDLNESFGVADSLINMTLEDGSVISGVRGVKRTFIGDYANKTQALKITRFDSTGCKDTILQISEIDEFWIYGIGKNPTIAFNVLPVKEYIKITETKFPKPLLELNLLGAYAGADESEEERQVGFDNIYFGLEANFFAASDFLLKDANLIISGAAISERSRWRIPLGLQYRWTITGAPKIVDTVKYQPNACRFQSNSAHAGFKFDPGTEYIENKFSGEKDTASVLLREKAIIYSQFRPYLFGEAGTIFDTGFDGSGSSPAINEDDYMQYYIGAGAGLSYQRFNLSISYRLMRLNLRTPCENCTDKFIVNTNVSHAFMLKLGYMINR